LRQGVWLVADETLILFWVYRVTGNYLRFTPIGPRPPIPGYEWPGNSAERASSPAPVVLRRRQHHPEACVTRHHPL
jgi:hypothetical protein